MTELPAMIVESSVVEGDLGYFLVGAILCTLQQREALTVYRGVQAHAFCPEAAFEVYENAAWLRLGDRQWKSWSSEVVMLCYEILEVFNIQDSKTLDLWIRAVGGETRDFWEMHRLCVSRQVMTSLVERGGQPLRALRMKA